MEWKRKSAYIPSRIWALCTSKQVLHWANSSTFKGYNVMNRIKSDVFILLLVGGVPWDVFHTHIQIYFQCFADFWCWHTRRAHLAALPPLLILGHWVTLGLGSGQCLHNQDKSGCVVAEPRFVLSLLSLAPGKKKSRQLAVEFCLRLSYSSCPSFLSF